MNIITTPLSGLFVVEATRRVDQRGFLSRLFCDSELKEVLNDRRIVQVNHTLTQKSYSIRGLHYQNPPFSEMKFVKCLRGRVWDVAVDIRRGSKTFLQWFAVELSADNDKIAVLPEGFAHGFQTLSDCCELLYFHTQKYEAKSEGGLRWDDPRIAIEWPNPVTELSGRDQNHPLIENSNFGGLEI